MCDPRIFSCVFNFIALLRLRHRRTSLERLAEGRNEGRQGVSRALRHELYVCAQRYCRGHATVVDLAEVEDEVTCEDGRDAEK